jgi:hypothetical protein
MRKPPCAIDLKSPEVKSFDSDGEKVSEIEIFHFNDVYEIEPRDREHVGGVARFIGKIKSFPEAMVLFSGDWFEFMTFFSFCLVCSHDGICLVFGTQTRKRRRAAAAAAAAV